MLVTGRKLPIGIQTFEDIRNDGYLYVDKTALMWTIANIGKPFFLSRPRRFGKSLLISTFEAYFKGRRELFTGLAVEELDGIFFDIVGIRPCSCSACRAEMKRRGIDASNPDEVRKFAKFSIDRFKEKMTALVRKQNPDCTIFYNAGHVGPCTRASRDAYTHFELESLPSGEWGYLHFPVTARYARTLGLDCMGMTGKFHTEWGDFHSLKNQAALEFECFRI